MSAAASVKARKDRVQLNSYCELNSHLAKAFDGSELDAAMEQADKTMVTGRAHAAALAAGKKMPAALFGPAVDAFSTAPSDGHGIKAVLPPVAG